MIWALHGAFGSCKDWKQFEGQLDAEVKSIDLWENNYALDFWAFAKKLNKEVRQLDSKPIILGYSMGGRLAMHCLIENPELWTAAIIVSANAGIEQEEKQARRRHDLAWLKKFKDLSAADFIDEWNSQPVLGKSSATVTKLNAEKVLSDSMARGLREWSVSNQDLLKVEDISCPTLLMAGSKDPKYLGIAEDLKIRIKNSSLKVLDAGHRVPWDQPENFLKTISCFLNS